MGDLDLQSLSASNKDFPHLPIWLWGLAFVFPPIWPFLLALYIARYPKTSAVIAGSLVAIVACSIYLSHESSKREEQANQARTEEEAKALSTCLSKYQRSTNVKEGDACLEVLLGHEAEERKQLQASVESQKSGAEFACRRAVKESLATEDGYHIPLGSVVTSPLAGRPGQYVTKFPFTVNNAFGVAMKHGVECVATGSGNVLEVNQLF